MSLAKALSLISFIDSSSFVRLEENLSALLECLHLEALGDCVLLRDLLVTLGGCCHLDGLEQRESSSGGW
jgi:hypothetical protein